MNPFLWPPSEMARVASFWLWQQRLRSTVAANVEPTVGEAGLCAAEVWWCAPPNSNLHPKKLASRWALLCSFFFGVRLKLSKDRIRDPVLDRFFRKNYQMFVRVQETNKDLDRSTIIKGESLRKAEKKEQEHVKHHQGNFSVHACQEDAQASHCRSKLSTMLTQAATVSFHDVYLLASGWALLCSFFFGIRFELNKD